MSSNDLTRQEILDLLTEVGQLLVDKGLEAAIYVVGGTAMALEYDSRRITRDVDAKIRQEPEQFHEAVRAVAQRHGIEPDWVNTSAVAFMTNEQDEAARELNLPGLRIAVASPEHLIAMKLRSLRERDMDDLEVLFQVAGVTRPEQAVEIHARLFNDSYIGGSDPEEALYAAMAVFERAAAHGRDLTREGNA